MQEPQKRHIESAASAADSFATILIIKQSLQDRPFDWRDEEGHLALIQVFCSRRRKNNPLIGRRVRKSGKYGCG